MAEPPHSEERGCRSGSANSNGRARVSKDEVGDTPSCFETAASPPPQHEGTETPHITAQPSCRSTHARHALGRPHPEERVCGRAAANPGARARVSKTSS